MNHAACVVVVGLSLSGATLHLSFHDPQLPQEPHTVHRIDLNSDPYPDFVVLEGEDEYFRSAVFIGTQRRASWPDSSLQLAYEQLVGPYVAIVDPDHDNHPELIASTLFEPTTACDEPVVLRYPGTILAAAVAEYHRLVGAFDRLNFKYGGMEEYPLFNLALDRSVHVLRVEGSNVRDVTNQFEGHFRWRQGILRELVDSLYADTVGVPLYLPEADRRQWIAGIMSCARGLRLLADSTS